MPDHNKTVSKWNLLIEADLFKITEIHKNLCIEALSIYNVSYADKNTAYSYITFDGFINILPSSKDQQLWQNCSIFHGF